MSYGELSSEQSAIVSGLVRCSDVHDLGAGDLTLSRKLLRLGARKVIAVDKEPAPPRVPKGVEYIQSHFDIFQPASIDIAFVSWPVNWATDIEPLVSMANIAIYLGKNTDGTVSGTPKLALAMLKRKLLVYRPDAKNTLIVTRKDRGVFRKPTGEELGMLDRNTIYSAATATWAAKVL